MDDAIAVSFNVDWFDANVSTPKMRQLEADLSEARRQLADAEASAKKANEDAGMYLWEAGQWKSQCTKAEVKLSAAQGRALLDKIDRMAAEVERDVIQDKLSAAQRDLAEARGIANELFAYTRALRDPKTLLYFDAFRLGDWSGVGAAYIRIRPEVRKEIER
jgi:chromosome segregation ATPase